MAMLPQRNVSVSCFLALCGGVLSSILGAIVLIGWYTKTTALIQISAAFVPMQFNTALGFLVSGLVLLVVFRRSGRLATVGGFFLMFLALLTLAQYIFGVNLGIDQLLMEHHIVVKTSNPGRMAPNTALCFLLTGAALVLLVPTAVSWKRTMIAGILGSLIFGLAIVALLGYTVSIEAAYGWGRLTRMAIHTASGFLVLGGAVTCLAWHRSVSDQLRSPSWLPASVGISVATIFFGLWQALDFYESDISMPLGKSESHLLLNATYIVIVIALAIALSLTVRLAQTARKQRDEVKSVNHSLEAEIIEHKQTQISLKHREARYRAIVEDQTELICRSLPDGTLTFVNDSYCRYFGQSRKILLGNDFLSVIPREDHAAVRSHFDTLSPALPVSTHIHRVIAADGEIRWQEWTNHAIFDRNGFTLEIQGLGQDITKRKKAEEALLVQMETQKLLQIELDHRVRNNLSSLLSLIELSRVGAESIDDFAEAIRSRTAAIASIHSILSDAQWRGSDLQNMLSKLVVTAQNTHIHFEGPQSLIPLAQAQALGLVINELSTNSVKYGAMSVDGASINITWTTKDSDNGEVELKLSWTESGGPPIEKEPKPGTGMNLIAGLIRSELRGSTDMTFPRPGAVHTLHITLTADATSQFNPVRHMRAASNHDAESSHADGAS